MNFSSVIDRVRYDSVTEHGVKKLKPADQVSAFNYVNAISTYTFNAVPLNLFRNSGASYQAVVRAGSLTGIGHIVLELNLTLNTSDSTVASIPYFFDRINFRLSGSNEVNYTMYNDTIMFNILSYLTKAQLAGVAKNLNLDVSNGGASYTNPLKAGTSKRFYLPLVGSWINNLDYYFSNSQQDLIIEIFPSANVIVNGSGTVDCNGLQLIVENKNITPRDSAILASQFSSRVFACNYLDVVPAHSYNQTLTAGVVNKIDLTNIRGLCSHLLVEIKATGASNTNASNMNLYNLGQNSYIDVITADNQSIFGNGVSVPVAWLQNEVSNHHFNTDVFSVAKNYYIIPFTNSIRGSYQGRIDGCMRFDGSKYQLAIQPNLQVAEVQTLTFSGTSTAGNCSFWFRGEVSQSVSFNASVGTIKSVLENMKTLRAMNATVTASGTISSGASITLTITANESFNGDLILVTNNSLLAGSTAVSCVTSETTADITGIASGTFDCYVYAFLFKEANLSKGQLTSRLL
jgi:hypothetical protein